MPAKGELIFLEEDSPRPSNLNTTINSQQPPIHGTSPDKMKAKQYYVLVNAQQEQTDFMSKRD